MTELVDFKEQDEWVIVDNPIEMLLPAPTCPPPSPCLTVCHTMNSLVVSDTTYFLRDVDDPHGAHYVVDGITAIIDPARCLVVKYDNVYSRIDAEFLRPSCYVGGVTDRMIAVPLGEEVMFYIRGIFVIDEHFIAAVNPAHSDIVRGKEGCLAVSGFEIIHGPLCKPFGAVDQK